MDNAVYDMDDDWQPHTLLRHLPTCPFCGEDLINVLYRPERSPEWTQHGSYKFIHRNAAPCQFVKWQVERRLKQMAGSK